MIQSVVATVRIRPGAEAEFEAIAKKLVAATNAEPGCLLYTLNKGGEPNAFMEGDRSVLRMQEITGPSA